MRYKNTRSHLTPTKSDIEYSAHAFGNYLSISSFDNLYICFQYIFNNNDLMTHVWVANNISSANLPHDITWQHMSSNVSQITGIFTVCSSVNYRPFMTVIILWPVVSPNKRSLIEKLIPSHRIIMINGCCCCGLNDNHKPLYPNTIQNSHGSYFDLLASYHGLFFCIELWH